VIHYKERRYYRDPETHAMKLTAKEENTYYHPIPRCILLKHPSFTSQMLEIPEVVHALLPVHIFNLMDNFGICI